MEAEQYFEALGEMSNFRSMPFTDVEMTDQGDELRFDGYAAVFGEVADIGDFTEEIERGAFKKVLRTKANVPLLHEHHPHQLLACTRSGRLQLEEDTRGLRAKARMVKTDLSLRVKALVESGDITGMSYGFVAGRENQQIGSRGGKPHRRLINFKRLLDVSTTWDPAFPSTLAQFRSQAVEFAGSPEEWQRLYLGAYPQLVEVGHTPDRQETEAREVRVADAPESQHDSGVSVPADSRSLAARKRALQFLVLTTGGINDET